MTKHDPFAAYLMTLGKEVYSVLRSKGASHEDAEDCIQNTMYKIYSSLEALDATIVRPWFFRVAMNDYIDFTRKKSRQDVSLTEAVVATFPDPDQSLDELLTKDQIIYLLKDVKEEYRELFILKYYYELSYEEIGELLQMKPNTVKQTLYRARKAVRNQRSR